MRSVWLRTSGTDGLKLGVELFLGRKTLRCSPAQSISFLQKWKYLLAKNETHPKLGYTNRYICIAKRKRLRPMLLIWSNETCNLGPSSMLQSVNLNSISYLPFFVFGSQFSATSASYQCELNLIFTRSPTLNGVAEDVSSRSPCANLISFLFGQCGPKNFNFMKYIFKYCLKMARFNFHLRLIKLLWTTAIEWPFYTGSIGSKFSL